MDIQLQLFQLIKNKYIEKETFGNYLADLLNVSTDSIYRRLRGETPLTVHEIQKLTNHFNISFDALCDVNEGSVLFQYSPFHSYDFSLESYLEGILRMMKKIRSSGNPRILFTVSNINFFQLINIPQLMRFRLFFWAKTHLRIEKYQFEKFRHEKTSPKAFDLGSEILEIYNSIPSDEIYDPEFMRGFLRQVSYYLKSHLFEDTEYSLFLCDRMIMLSEHLRKQCTIGKKYTYGTKPPEEGHVLNMYYNETINPDATFYFSSDETEGILTTHNILNYLLTTNQNYVNDSKQVLDCQIANSSLISIINEKERNAFFFEFENTINSFRKRLETELGK